MSEEKQREKTYPVRTLHDFLTEIYREWDKFRTGSLIGMIGSAALIFFILSFMLHALRQRNIFWFAFFLVVIFLLAYTIYSLYAQHQFFKKWERRIGLLLHLEEKLISEKLEEKVEE